MSRKKKGLPVTDEPRIHKVDSDEGLHHEHVQITYLEPEEDLGPETDEVTPELTWDKVKDSTETLAVAYREVHGVKLRDSDLYSLMHTIEHKSTVLEYLKRR